jgi:hypothetical protein
MRQELVCVQREPRDRTGLLKRLDGTHALVAKPKVGPDVYGNGTYARKEHLVQKAAWLEDAELGSKRHRQDVVDAHVKDACDAILYGKESRAIRLLGADDLRGIGVKRQRHARHAPLTGVVECPCDELAMPRVQSVKRSGDHDGA